MNEEELVRKCRKGDAAGQRELYDRYADRFYRLAIRYVKDPPEGEDVVMVAFVKIFNNLTSFTYTHPKGLESWMYRILVNEALTSLRKKHNFHLTEALDLENENHDQEVMAADADYLYQLILELPAGYRTVFNLYAIEGYDHHEIAGLLGITESTSRSQLFKARQLLKRKIQQEGIHYGT